MTLLTAYSLKLEMSPTTQSHKNNTVLSVFFLNAMGHGKDKTLSSPIVVS